MKIGFLGGFKHGDSETYEFDRTKDLSPSWIVKKEDIRNSDLLRARFEVGKNKSSHEAIVFYKLMVLRQDGEAKFFYVEPDQTKEQISEAVKQHWEISTTIGYDFD
mgnify:CR=1 FL=1